MKVWISKNSEISVREQLVTQITLGIVSGDLSVGEKLPSTREIARRFGIHSNTVSFVYRSLSAEGWLEFKKGSGFYVCEARAKEINSENQLDKLIADFVGNLRDLGFTVEEINNSLQKNLHVQPDKKLILVESDADFREILTEEINARLNIKTVGIDFDEFKNEFHKSNAVFVAMIDEKSKIENLLGGGQFSFFLKSRSIPASMIGERRPSVNDLIAVVSGWEKFLLWSKTILVAAQIEPECLILKNTKTKNWQKGLEAASMIICDSLTAKEFVDKEKVRVFSIISEQSLHELAEKYTNKML